MEWNGIVLCCVVLLFNSDEFLFPFVFVCGFCTCFVFECPLVCVCRVSRGVGMFDVCVELFLIDC